MKVLLTGGAGFIGSHTAQVLVAQGHQVRIFDDMSTGSLDNLRELEGRFELTRADLLDFAALLEAMRECDAVIHLAAVVSVSASIECARHAHEVNATGTLNVLEAARQSGICRVVLASSAAVYGHSPSLPLEEAMLPQALSPYAAQKWLGEIYARIYTDLHGMSPIALRYFNVFGPRQDPASPYSGVLSLFIGAMQAGRGVTIFGDGQQTRDFVHVHDVAAANVLALAAPKACGGQAINVGSGKASSILRAHETLSRHFPGAPAPRFQPPRLGDIKHSLANIDRARFLLGYRPGVSFEEGLAGTVGWAKKQSGVALTV